MQAPPNPPEYPVTCPTCDEQQGYPYQVSTLAGHPGAIEVKLRCRNCRSEWVVVATSPG